MQSTPLNTEILKEGINEGDRCNRNGCEGIIEISQEPCYCSATSMPPCSNCENSTLTCPVCSWEQ